MNYLQAVILGIVQGLTEFLPVSSSGHLVIVQHLFGMRQADLAFDVSVHLGTLIAVVAFFRRDISDILAELLALARVLRTSRSSGWQAALHRRPHARLALLIVIGSVPTAVLGLVLKQYADRLFASPFIAGGMLLLTGALLISTRRPQRRAREQPGRFRVGAHASNPVVSGVCPRSAFWMRCWSASPRAWPQCPAFRDPEPP